MNRTMKIAGLILLITAAVSGGYFYGRRSDASPDAAKARAAHEYTCPMHPFVLKDRPGACPVCSMELVRKAEGVSLDQDLKDKQHVALSPTQQVLANLATAEAVTKPLAREISCTGIVAYNQERQGKVSAWVGGRIDRLLVKSVGGEVRKGKPVAELFSVDLYNAQVQYLMAYKTIKVLNNSPSVPFPVNTQMALGDAHERLRQLGFGEEQFDRLQKADRPNIRVPLISPFSGVVTEKFVREGQYVNVGDPLFSVDDLSQIWVELELFENDLPFIKVGQEVAIHSRSYPGKVFRGRVKMIYPFLDAKTRTVKARVEIPNPGLKLKPEMYVQATVRVQLADSLVIPASAVMDTGTRQTVWVESRPGVFIPRGVKTGARSGQEIQILSGLKAGEKLAVSGGYLIDSEAQLSYGREAQDKPVAPPQRSHDPAMDMKEMKME